MGRAPCCDKANVKKGPWSPDEDAKLKAYIEQHGTGGNWIALPQKIGLKRCGKSCRLRWLNYLRPNIKHGGFSEEEDNIICSLYISIGSRWSIIAAQLPGRTDNDIKNYWNTRLKKKLLGKQRKEQQSRRGSCIKEGLRRETCNFMAHPEAINLCPNWPDLPLLVNPNHEPHHQVKDEESLKNLLLKFSDCYYYNNYNSTTFPYASTQNQPYEINSINMIPTSSSPTTNSSMHNKFSPMPNCDQYVVSDEAAGSTIYEGGLEMNLPIIELHDDIVYYGSSHDNNNQVVDTLEPFSGGMDMVNGSSATATTSTASQESASWEDITSLVFPSHHL